MSNVSVSVIIPAYNAEDYIEECILSVLTDKKINLEVIVVDDCSKDGTVEKIEGLQRCYPQKIKLLKRKNNGRQGAARNDGLKLARGEFIAFLDSDDYVRNGMYSTLYEVAIQEGADIVDSDLIVMKNQGDKKIECSNKIEQCGVLDYDKKRSLIVSGGRIVTKLYRRNLWLDNKISFPEGILYEDNAIGYLPLLYAKKMIKVSSAFYTYRRNLASSTRIRDETYLDRIKSANIMIDIAKSRGVFDLYHSEFEFKYGCYVLVNSYREIVKNFAKSEEILSEIVFSLKRKFPFFLKNAYYQNQTKNRKKIGVKLALFSPRLIVLLYKLGVRV